MNLFKEISENKKVMILANAAPAGSRNYKSRENVIENLINVRAKQVDIVDLDNSNLDLILDYDVIYALLKDFADIIATEQLLIPNGGHINAESGFDTFEDIVSYL